MSLLHPCARLPLLFALPILATTTTATAVVRAADPVTLFDETIAMGLPRSVVLDTSASQGRGSTNDGELRIESPLDVELRFPGDVPGTMYRATWEGHRAVVTRSGEYLDITVPHADGVDVTSFGSDTEASHHAPSDIRGKRIDGDVSFASGVPQGLRNAASGVTGAHPAEPETLVFWIFLHDDTLNVSSWRTIHANYVAWWIADMTNILPTRRLWAVYSRREDGLTNIPYGTGSSLQDWSKAIEAYERRKKLPRVSGQFEYKFMLLTNREPAPGKAGQAWLGGDQAIASLQGRYSIVAHEYGHTLGAIHEEAEVRWFSGWPCETSMLSDVSVLRSNCYRYSRANERRMRAHLVHELIVPLKPPYRLLDAVSRTP